MVDVKESPKGEDRARRVALARIGSKTCIPSNPSPTCSLKNELQKAQGFSLPKEHPVRKRFQVRENQLVILLETDDKTEAMKTWRESHRKTPSEYHEVYEFWNGIYNGICQFKPGDQVRW